jgi:hypothetical protein
MRLGKGYLISHFRTWTKIFEVHQLREDDRNIAPKIRDDAAVTD